MHPVDTLRFAAFSIMALLLQSTVAKADCVKPAWPDPASLKLPNLEAELAFLYAFQTRVQEFVACQRGSLEMRARGLAPSDVQQLIEQDRAAEERALVEVDRLYWCIGAARRESDPGIVRRKCDDYISWALDERRPPKPPLYTDLKSEQHNAYGGVWITRTLDFGHVGSCGSHGECENVLGVEVTNLTPVALRCEVALAVSNQQDGTHRGNQVISLNPGDSLPAARVHIRHSPEAIEPEVTCSRAKPLASESRIPAACALNWMPRTLYFAKGQTSRYWMSGTALLDFTARGNHKPPEAIYIVAEDTPGIGWWAQAQIEKLSFSTNCAGQRFRVRIEYRAFPCYGCWFETGVVALFRDDRAVL